MIYYAIGSALLSGEELLDASVFDRISHFKTDLEKGAKPTALEFTTGVLNVENFILSADTNFNPLTNEVVPWQPIGLGKPLTIMVREVYTGKYPKGNLFGNKKDLLITSAVKSIASFEAKPRALNFLMNDIASKTRLERPSASSQGTPITFYSPALLERSLTLDLSMVFDNFPQETFNQIGNFFTSAAGLPIFMAQSIYLIGAGMLVKLFGDIGEAIFDGNPTFMSSDGIDIFLPGRPPIPAGYLLISDDNIDKVDPGFRAKYQVNKSGEVTDSAGTEYAGDIPFIVISLDGTKTDELSAFNPTAASAAVLSRFFGMKSKQEQSLDVLMNALKLYNDFEYRRQIDEIDKKLATPISEEEKTALKEKREALLKNILQDIFKPKA